MHTKHLKLLQLIGLHLLFNFCNVADAVCKLIQFA